MENKYHMKIQKENSNIGNRQALVLYHIAAREKKICEMIEACLLNSGIVNNVVIGEAFNIIFHIYDYDPYVIVSFLPRHIYASSMFTMVKSVFQCIWIAIPTEGFFRLSQQEIEELIGYNNYAEKLIDYYYFWGKETCRLSCEQLLKDRKVVSEKQCNVFGYLPYEKKMRSSFYKKTACYTEITGKMLPFYKKTILVVLADMGKEQSTDFFVSQLGIKKLKDDELNVLREKTLLKNDYNKRYVAIISKMAVNYKDYLFLIKTHPIERDFVKRNPVGTIYDQLWRIDNVKLIDPDDPISIYFSISDLLVHYGSTTSIEAYINKIPSLCITDKRDNAGLFYGNKCIDIQDDKTIIEEIKDIAFSHNEELSSAAEDLMNFTEGVYYSPSNWLTELLKKSTAANHIKRTDKYVIKNLLYRAVIKRIVCFHLDLLKYVVSGNLDRAKRVYFFLKKYYLFIIGRGE